MYPAVVLAGGLGRRLRSLTGSLPKYFLKIFDYPLIMYPINTLLVAGVEKFVIVMAEKYVFHMKKVIDKYLCEEADVNYIINSSPSRENGYSLLLAVENIYDPYFILSVADHIYSRNIIEILRESFTPEKNILVGGDSNPRFINISEATKILAMENGKLLKIGKGLKKYTHIDTGIFFMKTSCIKRLLPLKDNKKKSLSKLIFQVARDRGQVYVSDVNGGLWTDVDTASDVDEIFHGERRKVVSKVLEEISIYVKEGGR